MSDITREHLHAFLDDALTEAEAARVEQALRGSEALRRLLQLAMAERDRGEHSIGAIWRRERLTCPSREELGSYLLGVLDDAEEDYLRFHLETVACPFCVANFADLEEQRSRDAAGQAKERRRRIYSAGKDLLKPGGE